MFGLDGKLLVIVVVALVLLGPEKLPGILKTLGKGYAHIRRMTMDVRSTIEREIREADLAVRAEPERPENLPSYIVKDGQAKPPENTPETPSETTPQADAGKSPVQGSLFDEPPLSTSQTDAPQEKKNA